MPKANNTINREPSRSFAVGLVVKRKERGLSQSKLAKRVGVDHTFISRIENGNRGLSLDVAVHIADALYTTVDDLIDLGETV